MNELEEAILWSNSVDLHLLGGVLWRAGVGKEWECDFELMVTRGQ